MLSSVKSLVARRERKPINKFSMGLLCLDLRTVIIEYYSDSFNRYLNTSYLLEEAMHILMKLNLSIKEFSTWLTMVIVLETFIFVSQFGNAEYVFLVDGLYRSSRVSILIDLE